MNTKEIRTLEKLGNEKKRKDKTGNRKLIILIERIQSVISTQDWRAKHFAASDIAILLVKSKVIISTGHRRKGASHQEMLW